MRHLILLATAVLAPTWSQGQEAGPLAEALVFHASFDQGVDADFAAGDPKLYTAEGTARKKVEPGLTAEHVRRAAGKGKYGAALEFTAKAAPMVFYRGGKNVGYRRRDYQGTVSLWLSLDPDKDLEPGYCDPIQITDKKWNDAALFIDFTKDDQPRHFRLGVFSDYKLWNPSNRKWEEIPPQGRPMIEIAKPPFARGKWTHVAFTFEKFNSNEPAVARLYLDGKLRGDIQGKQRLTWADPKVAMMLGLSYIGLLDDVAVFDRALTADEMARLHQLPDGVAGLRKK